MTSTLNTPLTIQATSRRDAGFGLRAIRLAGPTADRVGSPVVIAMSDGAAIGHEVYTTARNLDALAARGAG